MDDGRRRRVEVAALFRAVGHAFVVRDVDDETLDCLGTALRSALPRVDAAPARGLPAAEVRRLIFDAPQPLHHRLEHFPDCPGCGRSNPQGLAMDVRRDGDGVAAQVTLGPAWSGAPGRAHGGAVALIVDDLMGFALRVPAYTVALTVTYSAPVPIGVLVDARCRVVSREGRRIELEAVVAVGGADAARANGIFVTVPADRYDAA